jgi:hypothetical protein
VADLMTAAIPAAIAVVPAFLLYLQNKNSNDREAKERTEARETEERRQQRELEQERWRADVEGKRTARERERDVYVKFLRIVGEVQTGVMASAAVGYVYAIQDRERRKLAQAYETVLLEATPAIRDAALRVRESLDHVIRAARQGDSAVEAEASALTGWMDDMREAVAAHLQGSASGKEP